MGRLEICWRLKSRKPWEEPRLTFRNPCSFLAGHQIQLEAIRRVWGKGVRVRVTPQESIISTDCNPSFVRRYVRGGEADVCEAWNFPRASSIPIGIGPNGIEAALSPMLVNDRFFFFIKRRPSSHAFTLGSCNHNGANSCCTAPATKLYKFNPDGLFAPCYPGLVHHIERIVSQLWTPICSPMFLSSFFSLSLSLSLSPFLPFSIPIPIPIPRSRSPSLDT
jgi:hypothetical protein